MKELLGEQDVLEIQRERRASWLGHVWRSKNIAKDALEWTSEGRKQDG